MKRRTVLNAMKSYIEKTLENAPTDLISIEQRSSTNAQGDVENFVSAEVEIPKGYDELSRCRITVKIKDAPLTVTEAQLLDNDYDISFKGLRVSYIDSKENVYFKADSYEVKKSN